jgi:small subunit ribosomal protein S21
VFVHILAVEKAGLSNLNEGQTVQYNSDSNTIGEYFAGICPRQQCRASSQGPKKEDATREGVFREMKRRKAYEKPSERKTREKAEAIRRMRKASRKQAQREGLIPMPKRREDVRRSVARPRSF